MNKEVYIKNRKNLVESIEDDAIVILFAGNAPKKSADESYAFTPNRNFYYLTGVNEEDHVLLLNNNDKSEILFIKEIDSEMEKWVGKSLRSEKVEPITGIKEIKYLSNFEAYLNKVIGNSDSITIYLDLEKDSFNSINGVNHNFAKKLKESYPQVLIKNIWPKILPLRRVKSSEEIEEMQKAIDITVEGVNNIMRNIKPGMKEYEAEAYFEFTCRSNGIKDYAFKTIAAGGKNATILHYVDNNSELKDGDLVLFDLGAQYNYYNGDISRTIPVNGRFTDRQRDIYESVLRVNKEVIEMLKPGEKFFEINKKATELIADECIKLGLINENERENVKKYYYHSIGHSLGLDTHDVDIRSEEETLKPGMVYTVEPGIYIEEEGIGIRIEDDVLITEDGNDVLTKNMIKEVCDIEKFMANKNKIEEIC